MYKKNILLWVKQSRLADHLKNSLFLYWLAILFLTIQNPDIYIYLVFEWLDKPRPLYI
jgi:hypothetical protein